MFKPSKNPEVIELTKSCKERTYPLSRFSAIKLNGHNKNCVWCLKELKGARHKWCSNGCAASALSWSYPSGPHSIRLLLYKQNFECLQCGFSYRPYFAQAFKKLKNQVYFRHPRMKTHRVELIIRWLKRMVPKANRIEVDHISQVSLGGQVLGLENLQLLCAGCHKGKTLSDQKTRLSIKGTRKGVKLSEAHKKVMSESRIGFDSENRRKGRERMYELARIAIIATNVETKEEKEFMSLEDAAASLGLQACNISRVLNGKQRRTQHKGWTFRFKEMP